MIPGAFFVLGTLAIVVYMYWPVDAGRLEFPAPDASEAHVVVLAHGVRDTPERWATPLAGILEARRPGDRVVALDWSVYAGEPFRCSVAGKRVGAALGRRLAANPNVRSVHAIGHSCGAFVALGLCEAIRASGRSIPIQNTYLDPVSVYGGFFWAYGVERFGSCADFSEAYIDTEDTVPGSNQGLPLAHTFDVTEARKRSGHEGTPHNWPTIYYSRLAAKNRQPDLRFERDLGDRYPAGVLQKIAATAL